MMFLCRNFTRLIYNLTKRHKVNLNESFFIVNSTCKNEISFRFKYTKNIGVKGIGNQKSNKKSTSEVNSFENEEILIEDIEYDTLANAALNVVRKINFEHNVMVIQPYIKWGPKKIDIKPNLQLTEAESLIHSIPSWNVGNSVLVPVESFERKYLFGKGKLEELKILIKQFSSTGNKITCLFISKGTLSLVQKRFLEDEFQIPVMDRYSVVIQILRLHATSAEAKIQVAMAEIPYIWGQYKEMNVSSSRKQGYLNDKQKEILRNREKKLKLELEKIRAHRKLLRNKRKQKEFPIIAVVGYTNAGKTSLIKALTNEKSLQPRNQLFATLDVTAYAGFLPCKLEVIFLDTVGFMSDIPTGLLECFIATLEDAMMADIIIHVQDLAHENHIHQKLHVEKTLKSLIEEKCQNLDVTISSEKVVNVGNKIDLVANNLPSDLSKNLYLTSSKTFVGIYDLLKIIESKILQVTNRKKISMRVKNGGQEMSWLYKNSAVTNSQSDPENEEFLLMNVVISHANLEIFKHNFIKNQS